MRGGKGPGGTGQERRVAFGMERGRSGKERVRGASSGIRTVYPGSPVRSGIRTVYPVSPVRSGSGQCPQFSPVRSDSAGILPDSLSRLPGKVRYRTRSPRLPGKVRYRTRSPVFPVRSRPLLQPRSRTPRGLMIAPDDRWWRRSIGHRRSGGTFRNGAERSLRYGGEVQPARPRAAEGGDGGQAGRREGLRARRAPGRWPRRAPGR